MKTIKISILVAILGFFVGCKSSSNSVDNDDVYASKSSGSKKGSDLGTALNFQRNIKGKLSPEQLKLVHFTLPYTLVFTGSVFIPDISVVNGKVIDNSKTEIRSGKIPKGVKGTIKAYTFNVDGEIDRIMISFSKKHTKYQRLWFRRVDGGSGNPGGGYFYLEGSYVEDSNVFWYFSPGYLYPGWDLWNQWPCFDYTDNTSTVIIEEGDAEGDY